MTPGSIFNPRQYSSLHRHNFLLCCDTVALRCLQKKQKCIKSKYKIDKHRTFINHNFTLLRCLVCFFLAWFLLYKSRSVNIAISASLSTLQQQLLYLDISTCLYVSNKSCSLRSDLKIVAVEPLNQPLQLQNLFPTQWHHSNKLALYFKLEFTRSWQGRNMDLLSSCFAQSKNAILQRSS